MRIVTPREFARIIKKEKPSRVIITGSEQLFIKRTLQLIKERWNVPDESIKEFHNPKDVDLAQLAEALASTSIFSTENLVIVRRAQEFVKGLGSKEKVRLRDIVTQGPQSTCLVLIEEEELNRPEDSPLVKLLVDEEVMVVNCRRARPQEMRSWLKKRLTKYGLDDEGIIETLIACSGGSMERLERELDKLLTSSDKDALSTHQSHSPWDLANAILNGDWEALGILDELVKSGSPYPLILTTIQSSLRNLLLFATGQKRFSTFAERNMRRLLEKTGIEKIKEIYKESIALEKKLKFSSLGQFTGHAFQEFVVSSLLKTTDKPF